MGSAAFERIGPDPQRVFKQMLRLIFASYLLDALVLCLFVYAGIVAGWVPLAYGLAGSVCCAFFYTLIDSGFTARFADGNVTIWQLGVAASIQLLGIIIAPEAAHYFTAVLFLIFAFSCLRLRERDAVIAWGLIAIAFLAAIVVAPVVSDWRLSTPLQRLCSGVGTMLVLARCTWLGVYANRARHVIRSRRDEVRNTLSQLEVRNARVATALHEDLGQQLAGVSLLLSAVAHQLRNERHGGAEDVIAAASHLSDAVEKVRALAKTVDNGTGRQPASYPGLLRTAQQLID